MTSRSGVRDLGFSGDLDLDRDFGIGEASDKSLSISTLGKTCKQFFTVKFFQTIHINTCKCISKAEKFQLINSRTLIISL